MKEGLSTGGPGIGDLTGTASFREDRMARHDSTEGNSMVTVHVYRAEEGGFWAEMPEYPGCYTQGETMDELKENVREAVLCYI